MTGASAPSQAWKSFRSTEDNLEQVCDELPRGPAVLTASNGHPCGSLTTLEAAQDSTGPCPAESGAEVAIARLRWRSMECSEKHVHRQARRERPGLLGRRRALATFHCVARLLQRLSEFSWACHNDMAALCPVHPAGLAESERPRRGACGRCGER